MLGGEKIMPGVSDKTLDQRSTAPAAPDLVARAAHDAGAFSALYRQYLKRVYRYILARVGNHAEAEDLTAQVFMAVLQQLKHFSGNQNFPAWLFTIARNKVVDNYRQNRKAVPLDALVGMAAQGADPDTQAAQAETIADLQQVIVGLLHLRFAGQLSYAEIGLVIGKTEAAVKQAMHRLLRQLQDKMENDNE